MRAKAALALGAIEDSRAVAPLIESLKDEVVIVRKNSATALGQLGVESAVNPLIEALTDEDAEVRISVALSLGDLGASRADECGPGSGRTRGEGSGKSTNGTEQE